jgi:hypothetical protein
MNQQCSICERTNVSLHQDYVTGRGGRLPTVSRSHRVGSFKCLVGESHSEIPGDGLIMRRSRRPQRSRREYFKHSQRLRHAKLRLSQLRITAVVQRASETLLSIDAKIVQNPECAKRFEAVLYHINHELKRKHHR